MTLFKAACSDDTAPGASRTGRYLKGSRLTRVGGGSWAGEPATLPRLSLGGSLTEIGDDDAFLATVDLNDWGLWL